MTNLGAHDIDIVHWAMGFKGPTAVSSSGGRFVLKPPEDNGETPDTQDAIFEYPGLLSTVSIQETSQGRRLPFELEFFGTKGSLSITRAGYEITCDPKRDPSQTIPTFQGHPTGGPRGQAERRETQPAPVEFWCSSSKEPGSSPEQFSRHVRNFLDSIKSREQPVSDVEGAHQVATACHLANISLRLGRKIRWNPETEEILEDAQASAMLERPYRAPWDDVRKSLLA
jgi:predicted dehydrogenase